MLETARFTKLQCAFGADSAQASVHQAGSGRAQDDLAMGGYVVTVGVTDKHPLRAGLRIMRVQP